MQPNLITAMRRIQRQEDPAFHHRTNLRCRFAFYKDSPVLYLQKPAWKKDRRGKVPNPASLFFAIWLTEKGLQKHRIHYNIHALKIWALKYAPQPTRQFAQSFRTHFKKHRHRWPNARTNFGPQNLIEGWIPLNEETFNNDLLNLMRRFEKLAPLLDNLLNLQTRQPKYRNAPPTPLPVPINR
jgi:hypothetical protein